MNRTQPANRDIRIGDSVVTLGTARADSELRETEAGFIALGTVEPHVASRSLGGLIHCGALCSSGPSGHCPILGPVATFDSLVVLIHLSVWRLLVREVRPIASAPGRCRARQSLFWGGQRGG